MSNVTDHEQRRDWLEAQIVDAEAECNGDALEVLTDSLNELDDLNEAGITTADVETELGREVTLPPPEMPKPKVRRWRPLTRHQAGQHTRLWQRCTATLAPIPASRPLGRTRCRRRPPRRRTEGAKGGDSPGGGDGEPSLAAVLDLLDRQADQVRRYAALTDELVELAKTLQVELDELRQRQS